jgi:ankyrin repeat protein
MIENCRSTLLSILHVILFCSLPILVNADNDEALLFGAIEKNNLQELREQIPGTNLDEINEEEGVTPLIAAVMFGRSEMVQVLLRSGANPNLGDKANGATPLMWGSVTNPGEIALEKGIPIPSIQSKIEIVQALLKSGARINEKDQWGGCALQWGADAGNIEIVKILVAAGADINSQDMDGFTPLIAAANYETERHNEVVKFFLSKGAKVDQKSKKGETALFFAIHNFKIDNVATLIKAGADINLQAQNGISPLMKAVQLRRVEITKQLLGAGADARAKNHDGKTPLAIATESGYTEIIDILKKYGASE